MKADDIKTEGLATTSTSTYILFFFFFGVVTSTGCAGICTPLENIGTPGGLI